MHAIRGSASSGFLSSPILDDAPDNVAGGTVVSLGSAIADADAVAVADVDAVSVYVVVLPMFDA